MSAPVETFTIPAELAFRILDALRLAHIYALKDSHPEELVPDFKPWKWDGHEVEYAEDATQAYRDLLDAMGARELLASATEDH